MSDLRKKLSQNSVIEDSAFLEESKFYSEKDMIPTDFPMINVALSGRLDGGLIPGVTQLCGPSKHFKSMFSLLLASAYMKKYPDACMLLYLTEFGTPLSYFDQFNIDKSRVFVEPVVDVETLKIAAVKQLEAVERGDKLIVVIDSIGNVASKKELEDALSGKTVAEVGSRAKALKSFFRMVTPYFAMKDIPCVVVNHSYKTMEMFSRDTVSGGTGSYYASDTIWMLGRQQEKEAKELVGYNFIIKIEKSRYVREGAKIPVFVRFDGQNGHIQKWSGMLDLALESGFVEHVGRSYVFDGKKYNADEVETDDFWNKVLEGTNLAEWIEAKYSLEKR